VVSKYVISHCESLSDLLEVGVLLREAGLLRPDDADAGLDVDVIPLFESIADLERCGAIMESAFAEGLYRGSMLGWLCSGLALLGTGCGGIRASRSISPPPSSCPVSLVRRRRSRRIASSARRARVCPIHRSRKLKPMRFPLALTAKIATHIVKHKLARTPKFAMVLQLEPLHTCNLTCTGCGRIREYSTSLKDMMPLEDCLQSAQECKAPCQHLWWRAADLSDDRGPNRGPASTAPDCLCLHQRHVHAEEDARLHGAHYGPEMEVMLLKLLAEKLITVKDAEAVRKADDKARGR